MSKYYDRMSGHMSKYCDHMSGKNGLKNSPAAKKGPSATKKTGHPPLFC